MIPKHCITSGLHNYYLCNYSLSFYSRKRQPETSDLEPSTNQQWKRLRKELEQFTFDFLIEQAMVSFEVFPKKNLTKKNVIVITHLPSAYKIGQWWQILDINLIIYVYCRPLKIDYKIIECHLDISHTVRKCHNESYLSVNITLFGAAKPEIFSRMT